MVSKSSPELANNRNAPMSTTRMPRYSPIILILLLAMFVTPGVLAQETGWPGPVPEISELYRGIVSKFDDYTVVLAPDKDSAEYWAGAPSVVRDRKGTFWMAARMRSPQFPRGLRGYEIRILRSADGVNFREVHTIKREEVPIPGFERPAMLLDPLSGKFKLFVCGPWQNGPWCILKLYDVEDPTQFDPSTARPVITAPERSYPRDVSVSEYKDPFILFAQNKYHCYVTGYVRRNERIFHYISDDGEKWNPTGNINQPVMDLSGWHNFFIRPSSVLPLGVGYLFIYEGSSTEWFDPVYNIVTGLGYTFDLHHITDLTPDAPLLVSTTADKFYTWRYSHWIWVENKLYIYAEVAKSNHAHEIRLFKININSNH